MKQNDDILKKQDEQIDAMLDSAKIKCKELLRQAYASGAMSEDSALLNAGEVVLTKSIIQIYFTTHWMDITSLSRVVKKEYNNLKHFI
jgi:hypothetical protein